MSCSTNLVRISHEFHTNFTWLLEQLLEEKFNCWRLHTSSFHAGRHFKPHTQQLPKKGPAHLADSSSRSHSASQSGPEPRAESKPELGLDS